MIWESPAEWRIEQFLLADADNDGREELLMLLWKTAAMGMLNHSGWRGRPDI